MKKLLVKIKSLKTRLRFTKETFLTFLTIRQKIKERYNFGTIQN